MLVKKERKILIIDGKQKLSPKTILHHHRLISSILTKAVQWQIIKENVANRVESPKVPKHETPYLDKIQAKELMRLLENEPMQYKTAITLLIYTGLRHTNTTLMIATGADIRSISYRLGHSNTSTTLNIYSHFSIILVFLIETKNASNH